MVITATATTILAALGTSIIAGSNLINGWRQRKFQEEEGNRQREFSREQQELQLQFQRALQEKSFKNAEELQRQMVALQFKTALALQKTNFEGQRAMWEDATFYANLWPLRATPRQYVENLVNTYSVNKVPLQILVPESLSQRIVGLGTVMNYSYSMHTCSPTFYYTGGWKNNQTITGTALLSTLHSVLKGLPTLVLIPSGSFRDKIKIEIGYWGMGGLNDIPLLREVATVDMHKLDFDLIRKHTDELIALYRDEEEKLAGNVNVEVRRKELSRRTELTSKGTANYEIERKLWQEFSDEYQRKGIEWELDEAKQKIFEMVLEVVCAGYADVYHLLQFNTMPQAPLIAKTNPLFADNAVRSMLVKLYDNAIKSLGRDSEARLLQYPLCNALIAKSCHEAGWTDDAEIFAQKAGDVLQNLYHSSPDKPVAKSHYVAVKLLKDGGFRSIGLSQSTMKAIMNNHNHDEEIPVLVEQRSSHDHGDRYLLVDM